ncbi:MAG TPA: PAS domain S-box protein [Thermoanaerobaculia bacterium]|jgi:PAS domain S-box-containing protein|nr:PAS domain S-box protein [Thermoanaerobaculia bacterium]
MRGQTTRTATVFSTLDALGLGCVVFHLADPDSDESLTFHDVNDHASILTGLPMRDFIGLRLNTTIPSVPAAGLPPIYARVARTGVTARLEQVTFPIEPMQGHSYRVTAYSPDQNFVGVIFDNITERIDAAERIHFQSMLLNAVEQGVIATTLDGRVTFVNPHFERQFGWTADELVGQDVRLITRDDTVFTRVRDIVARGETFVGQTGARRRDGVRFPSHVTASPLRASDAEVNGIVAIVSDITERVSVEEALRVSEARVRALLEAIPDMVIRLSRFGVVIEASLPPDDRGSGFEVGRAIADFLHRDAASDLQAAIDRALSDAALQTVELDHPRDQVLRHFEARLVAAGTDEVVAIIRDVSERKRFERALLASHEDLEWRVRARTVELREVNEALRALIDASPFGIVSLDAEGRVRSWNRAAEQIFGWSAVEAIGRIHPIVPEDELEGFHHRLGRIIAGDRRWDGVERFRLRKDGTRVCVRISHAILKDLEGRDIGVISLLEDVTNEHAGRDLAARAERQMSLLRTFTDAVHRANDIEDVLAALSRHLAPAGIAGGMLSLKLHERQERFVWSIDAASVEELEFDERIGNAQVRFSPSAAERFGSFHVVPVRSRQGLWGCALFVSETEDLFDEELQRVLRVVGGELGVAVENIVLYRNMEEAIARAHALSQRIANIRESERSHIGRELHDQLGQSLTALKFSLETASRSGSPPVRQLRSAAKLVGEIISEVRGVSLALRGPMLDRGLFEALGAIFQRCHADTGIDVISNCTGDDTGLPRSLGLTAYRIVQESLTNVARHSGVRSAQVNITVTPTELALCIDDEGVGFDVEATLARTTGGLSGIIDRVDLAGGSVRIESRSGAGTHIEVHVPRRVEDFS